MLNSSCERVLFRALADYMPHCFYAKDTQGRFVFANQAVAVGMGASCPEDLLDRSDFDFYPPDEVTDELPTIFEPHVQVGAVRRRNEGFGLGLAISRGLVQALGGEIAVNSKAGEGSLFSFELALPVEAVWSASITPAAARYA